MSSDRGAAPFARDLRARPPDAAGAHPRRARRRHRLSPLTRRILAVNLIALAILFGGQLYLDEYHRRLIDTELDGLRVQAELFAGALAEGAVDPQAPAETANAAQSGSVQRLAIEPTRQIVRRLVGLGRVRARLFEPGGTMIVDSRVLVGPGGAVQVQVLPPPPEPSAAWATWANAAYDWVFNRLPRRDSFEPYREPANQAAADYEEVRRALVGEAARAVRVAGNDRLVLAVSVPIQRYRQVLGALLLTLDGAEIDEAMREVRLDILKLFALACAITVLLSIYLAGTIARPIRRLSDAADRVRHGHGRNLVIPDLSRRDDEIGDLSGALREMTEALWQRLDAIERFAADVAHEIKNPLTSLRSAVETVQRVDDPAQQKKLLAIVVDDVRRLDRLITDISDASRLDAELSRAETEPVDLARMLEALVEMHTATRTGETAVRLVLDIAPGAKGRIPGLEGRLAQVLRNLIANAMSFSPPGGTIRLALAERDDAVIVTVEDEGPGLPEGKLEAIFERFYSERPKGEKFGTHSGLGLSISKQIVDAHRGTIRAENRRHPDGRVAGARFIVRLPRA
jgi:two-component system sensor histidine kinase ChvG